jgi:hypothetical protein
MAARLGGQQISALLENLPGIASVLRSPVADAIVGLTRAGVGIGEFRIADANELTQFAVRRGLLGSEEADELLTEVREAEKKSGARRGNKAKAAKKTAKKPPSNSVAARKKTAAKKVAKKATARPAAKKTKATKRKR